MTKRTINGGFIILLVFTVLVAVGIFLMQRYNGIANSEAKVLERAAAIDATVSDQEAQAKKLLEATRVLKDTKEYSELSVFTTMSLVTYSPQFMKDEATFQKHLQAYTTLVSNDGELSKNDAVTNILGQIQGDEADLRNEKVAYNAAVKAYDAKRNARPRFYGELLGFTAYDTFTTISAPLDATPDQNTEENQNPDINSFN